MLGEQQACTPAHGGSMPVTRTKMTTKRGKNDRRALQVLGMRKSISTTIADGMRAPPLQSKRLHIPTPAEWWAPG
jgi:hypothetical protein